jgi:hypothetical protein
MKTAGVVVDTWKAPTFKKHLDKAGYSFIEGPGLTPGTTLLQVKYEWAAKLQPVIQAANDACKI